jgi:IMP dehydrogenase
MEIIGHRLDNPRRVYAFEELLLLPGLARLSPRDIDTGTALGGLRLNAPFISAPMDTVTGSEMAIALAMSGGLGVVHRNCSVDEAVEMVSAVKKAALPGNDGTAAKDSKNRLAVGAALSPFDIDRAAALAEKADLLFIDVASFYNIKVIEGTKKLIDAIDRKIVIGNLGTQKGVAYAVKELGEENIAAVKVGMGGGSICTTTDVTGVGSPVTYAVEQAARALKELKLIDKIPIIADGGLRCSRDIALSLCLGASSVMLGNLFARCAESLGEKVVRDGKAYKVYWGMGSPEARRKRMALDRYQLHGKGKDVDEGIKTYLPMDGKVAELVDRLVAELKVTMGYIGAKSVEEMKEVAEIVVKTAKEPKVSSVD